MKTSHRNIALQPLSFSLYQRPVHPELFNIYRQFDFSSKKFTATLWITNLCHVLTVCAESIQITELIAMANQPLPAGALLAKFQLTSQKHHTHVFGNRLKYHCNLDLVSSTSAEHEKQHEKLKQLTSKNSMLINFPKLSTDSHPAFTFVETRSGETELNIHTQHSRHGRPELITTNTTIDLSQIR